jgi:hypothetical protein
LEHTAIGGAPRVRGLPLRRPRSQIETQTLYLRSAGRVIVLAEESVTAVTVDIGG